MCDFTNGTKVLTLLRRLSQGCVHYVRKKFKIFMFNVGFHFLCKEMRYMHLTAFRVVVFGPLANAVLQAL